MTPASTDFVIAALGASAGGLEALETFFRHMPPDSGIAFVVVQHLAPDHSSALAELLSRFTKMPVEQAHDQIRIAPDRVYIIPPNATLTVKSNTLQVTSPTEPRGFRMPIDSLFSSLAEDCGEYAVCIMLSGTGNDGTAGLRAIKEYGGIAMAQTLESAKYDAIPRNAIATGLVDHVLPVEGMPAKLVEYAAYLHATNGRPHREQIDPAILANVHTLLHRRTGHDFSQYKENTIVRRLLRRMKALQIDTAAQYFQLLEKQPEEADRLFKDLLIGVTHFFRDPDAFQALQQEVIPKIFEGKDSSNQVRACIVGCASGEEAYSIAILLCEHAAQLRNPPQLKVFATDIDDRGLELARKGRYPESIAEYVSPERLSRFFTRTDNTYQVNRELREICLFTCHSFIKDPPFSRLDLISCRNVMIYLAADLQRKIVRLFHYALRPGGYLFLGPSEDVSAHRDLFSRVDKKHRIFRQENAVRQPGMAFPLLDLGYARKAAAEPNAARDVNFSRQIERLILQRYRPACVAVLESGDAVYFSGRMGTYLEPPTGSPDNNVINMARDGLRIPLRAALHKAASTHERVAQKQIPVRTNGSVTLVDLTVEPIEDCGAANLYMVIFEDAVPEPAGAASRYVFDSSTEETIHHLESELRSAGEQAQAMFEELETSNEELKSANEEYQSTNEELETSKEEIQSANEELETVNAELNRRLAELDQANNDLQNLNNSTRIATIFLDGELRIKSFTPAAGSLFRFISGDIGRPITDLVPQFADGLGSDIQEVLRTLAPSERSVAAAQDRHFLMRILPYRTIHNVIDGVVVTFTDITALKKTQQLLQDAKIYAETIVDMAREPLLVLDADLRVKSANQAFYRAFSLEPHQTLERFLYDLGQRQWDVPELRHLLSRILPEKKMMEDFSVEHEVPGSGRVRLLFNAREIPQQNGASRLILLAIDDITARSRAEASLLSANQDLRCFAYAASHDLQEPLRMVTSYTQLLSKYYRGKLDNLGDQFIGYAVEGAQRMEMLLKGLRDYWTVNEETPPPNQTVDSGRALEQSLIHLESRIRETAAAIAYDPLPPIQAEEFLLILLFKNLIANALKYARPGVPPVVHISARREDNTWNFSVQDNGIGIESEYLVSIFAPFKRLHDSQQYPGSGLGLAICQRIVERHEGKIWAESKPGEGSTFHFTIPAKGNKL